MIEDLHELLNRQPFEPFRIILTSGDRIEVTAPGNVAAGATRIGYFTPKTDRWVMIRTNQIVMLESANAAA